MAFCKHNGGGLDSCPACQCDTGIDATFIQYITDDLPTLDLKQLGKVYRYVRRVRAGLDITEAP